MIDGVCGGIAEYFDVDPTIVRIFWVFVTLLGGSGFVLYIVGMIIMPVNPEHLKAAAESGAPPRNGSDRKRFLGVLLILIGLFILLMNFGMLAGFSWWSFSRSVLLPIFFIILGALFIYIHAAKKKQPPPAAEAPGSEAAPLQPPAPPAKELRRSISERKLFGVCGGLARYFGIDPTIVRFLFIVLVLASFGWGLLLYILMGLIMPEEKLTTT
jgi:phage shock protein C